MNILVIAPYEEKIIRALNDASNVKNNTYILLGNRKTIIELFFKNKISYLKYEIIEATIDTDIVISAKKIISTHSIAYVIFGDVSKYFQKKILNIDNMQEFNKINIIDIPHLRHFIFISNVTEKISIDFEIKKQMIILGEKVMNNLDIKKINVGMISETNNKTDYLETKLIRMIFHDDKANNINIFEIGSIYDLFSKRTKYNIYNTNINLLVMRNYDNSQVFIDTLNVFSNTKIANIIVNNIYAIDSSLCKDHHDILFSILIMNKIIKNCHIDFEKKVVNSKS